MFSKYHYLDKKHNNAAHCYIAEIENKPVAFLSVLHFPHSRVKKMKRVHRLVVLPDYQGIGIGIKFLYEIANLYKKQGYRFSIVTSTPALINSLKPKDWMLKSHGRKTTKSVGIKGMYDTISRKRVTYSFEKK